MRLEAEQFCCFLLQGDSASDILTEFGRGKLGSMMALTQQLLATSELWVYGGFLRDAVIRGDVHDAMDLDVGLPKSGNMKAAAGMDTVTKLAAGLRQPYA